MENFTLFNPVTLHFGRDVIQKLPAIAAGYGNRVLFVYGKGSIKSNGIYDQVISQLNAAGIKITEYGGIKPNPVVEDVDAAAVLGRNNHVDMIIAVGGGSVIDSAKAISLAIPVSHSAWDFYSGKVNPQRAIPLIAVLTLAATGTEMNMFSVVQNHADGRKLGYGHPLMYPVHSFLDPSYTFSVSAKHTAYGIADLIAHCLENYFGLGAASLTDRFIFSIISEAVEYSPKVLAEPYNYEYRAAIMFAATMALNGLTVNGKGVGDWGVHSTGHVLSLLYDIPHGATLSIVYPAWLKLHMPLLESKILQFGNAIFGTNTAIEAVESLERFFTGIGCPVTLPEAGITAESKNEILAAMKHNRVQGINYKFSALQWEKLLDLMF
ncbi:MAG TPA: iron-containing alcohol dehydrogenase [Bacteroidales bacterium]|nr:iron-containing alcohol dehydrogenase [Bacteroidales bacterium]